jgi:hypothetical protein
MRRHFAIWELDIDEASWRKNCVGMSQHVYRAFDVLQHLVERHDVETPNSFYVHEVPTDGLDTYSRLQVRDGAWIRIQRRAVPTHPFHRIWKHT